MGKSVFSNNSAQKQSIFKTVKSLLKQDELFTSSADEALSSVVAKNNSNFSKYLNLLKENDPKGFEDAIKAREVVSKMQDGNVTAFGKKLSSETSSKIHEAVTDKVVVDNMGLTNGNMEKIYKKTMSKTKRDIGKQTMKNAYEQYYKDPLSSGILGHAVGMNFKDNLPLQKATARIGVTAGAVAGTVGIGAAISKSANDKDLKNINRELKRRYDANE